jgi:hypothetical protein
MCVRKCTVLKGVSNCVPAPPPQSLCTTCSSSAFCEWATGQACTKAPLTHVARWKRGGSGVTSCAAESPGQSRPGALPALSLADGRWKEGSTEEREPCARGGLERSRRVSSIGGEPRAAGEERSTEEREPCARGGVQACV